MGERGKDFGDAHGFVGVNLEDGVVHEEVEIELAGGERRFGVVDGELGAVEGDVDGGGRGAGVLEGKGNGLGGFKVERGGDLEGVGGRKLDGSRIVGQRETRRFLGVAAEFVELGNRFLLKLAVGGDTEEAGDGEAAVPAVAAGEIVDPAPKDAAAIVAKHGVGGVKAGAVIHPAAGGGVEAAGAGIEITDEPLGGGGGGDDEDPVIADLEKVGAFDVANVGIGMLKKNAAIDPLGEGRVLGFVDVDDGLAAFALVEVAAADEKGFARVVKDKGIAPFVDFAVAMESFGEDGVVRQLAPVDELAIAEGGPLFGVVAGGTVESDAGVEDHGLAVAIDGAGAGPDALLIEVSGRAEGDGEALPMGEVAAADVAPVFWAVALAEGVELIKEVIPAVVVNRAVGVVHPLGGSDDVEGGIPRIGLGARRGGVDGGLGAGDGVVVLREERRDGEKEGEQARSKAAGHVGMSLYLCQREYMKGEIGSGERRSQSNRPMTTRVMMMGMIHHFFS